MLETRIPVKTGEDKGQASAGRTVAARELQGVAALATVAGAAVDMGRKSLNPACHNQRRASRRDGMFQRPFQF